MASAQGAWHGNGDQSRRVPEPQGEFGLTYGLGSRQGEVQMGFSQGGVVVSFVLEEDHPVCGMENKRGVSGRRGCWELRAAAVPHICTRTSGEKSRLDRGGPGRAGVEAGGDLILPRLPWPLASRLVVLQKAGYHPTRRSLPLLEFWATAPCIKADIEP